MANIKIKEMHLERSIEIKQKWFHALLIARATWHHLDGPSKMQQPWLNRNDLQLCILSEPLIED